VGHSGKNDFFEILENPLHGFALPGRILGKLTSDFARFELRFDRELLDFSKVIGCPINEFIPKLSEGFFIHQDSPSEKEISCLLL
jgi:hypothetical protein